MTPLRFGCQDVDELAGALALGAVDADQARAAREHLSSCPEPHAELRSLLGADAVLAAGLDPVQPSAALRERLMASVDAMPRRPEAAMSVAEPPARRGWLDWLSPQLARPMALAGVGAALALAVVSVSLAGQLGDRDRALRAVASALAADAPAHRVEGPAGRGYVVDTEGAGAAFIVADVQGPLAADELYELWLIGPEGPVDVGVFRPRNNEITVIPVERDLSGFETFAVTVEAERVTAPTGDPVMAGAIGS
ncbi:MAG TPA: anti-sigma factor [Candidatus Limnocylindria bacterium]|nr:anti-sigma factor [Candidatus Limnocylindria bacterium]